MKVTNSNFTPEAVHMAYHQILQLLSYGTSQPAPLARRDLKLSMAVTIACQDEARRIFADMFSVDMSKVIFMERVFTGLKSEVSQLGLSRTESAYWLRIHEFDAEEGFRAWDWLVPMANPVLVSHIPIAKYSFED